MLRPETIATVVLLRDGAIVTAWPLEVDGSPDLSVVEELARSQLAARRMGMSIALREPRVDLVDLLRFVGLRCVLKDLPGSVEVGGQAERSEEGGVEEAVMPDDPAL